MYVIIKSDKAEHLKEKLHHIKTAAMEVLDCIEVARHTDHISDEYSAEHSRHRAYGEHERGLRHDDYDDFEHDMARRRGRGRY